MSDLRTRIAAAIAKADGDIGPDSWDFHLADAVIRELALKEDETQTWITQEGQPKPNRKTRYVTEWNGYCNQCGRPHNGKCLRQTTE